MKISKLLELDRAHKTANSLPYSFGDSFLLAHNKFYKKIREGALQTGFQYSLEYNSNYSALGLSQLEEILSRRCIPYADNVSVLNEIEKKIQGTTTWDEVSDNLKRNFVFHESCHVVARAKAKTYFASERDATCRVINLLLEESFANSIELLGIVEASDSAHRIFYEHNSYSFVYDSKTHLQNLISDIGLDSALSFLIFCYLHSNFRYDNINEQDFRAILKNLSIEFNKDSKIIKNLKGVSRIAFQLNPRFIDLTSGFYLRLNGLKMPDSNFKLMDNLALDSRFLNYIKDLSSGY
jgi:hypothetical protein